MPSPMPPVWFDPQFKAQTLGLRQRIRALMKLLSDYEPLNGLRQRARTQSGARGLQLAIEALACNLILFKATGCDTKLAVPRSHDFLWSGDRLQSPVYGQHFLDAISLLTSLGLIEDVTRGYRVSETNKAFSLIAPTDALAEHLPLTPPDWQGIACVDDPTLIVLRKEKDKAGRADAVRFKESARTKQLAGQVKRINKHLRQADIDVLRPAETLSVGKDGQIIVPCRRSLRRIFNNKNWQHGGRLAGGFWMSMERAQRFEQIRLGGERIADVDYRQLFPRLAYVRAHAAQPEGDVYDITGDGTGRPGWKTLMNALLFSTGPLKNWPTDTLEHFADGMKLRDAVAMLQEKHPAISHLFGTGLGFQLMRIESDMLIAVILYLFKQGITALPLHDAVLVAHSHAEVAKEALEHEFELRSGHRGAIVQIDFGPAR